MSYRTPRDEARKNIMKAYSEIRNKDIDLLKEAIKKYGKKQALNRINNSKCFDFMI